MRSIKPIVLIGSHVTGLSVYLSFCCHWMSHYLMNNCLVIYTKHNAFRSRWLLFYHHTGWCCFLSQYCPVPLFAFFIHSHLAVCFYNRMLVVLGWWGLCLLGPWTTSMTTHLTGPCSNRKLPSRGPPPGARASRHKPPQASKLTNPSLTWKVSSKQPSDVFFTDTNCSYIHLGLYLALLDIVWTLTHTQCPLFFSKSLNTKLEILSNYSLLFLLEWCSLTALHVSGGP